MPVVRSCFRLNTVESRTGSDAAVRKTWEVARHPAHHSPHLSSLGLDIGDSVLAGGLVACSVLIGMWDGLVCGTSGALITRRTWSPSLLTGQELLSADLLARP